MKFKTVIIETYKEVIEVEAENEQEAVNKAWELYSNEENLGGEVELDEVRIEIL